LTKKDDEIKILKKFINKSGMNIQILSYLDAVKEFPSYNNENPDFIIRLEDEIIGIELFKLISNKFVPGLLSVEEQKLNIINLAHLKNKREKLNTNLLYENDDLGNVAVEMINAKKDKINLYITDKIWLIGYANEKYNFNLIKTVIEDDELSNVCKHIRSNIFVNDRIQHLYLFQCYAEEIIIEIK